MEDNTSSWLQLDISKERSDFALDAQVLQFKQYQSMLRTAKVNQREIKENLVWININWENYVERINLNLNLEK